MNYKFTVEHDGQIFECEREVTGTVVQQQKIIVSGCGKKSDPAKYGKKLKSGAAMEIVARMVAAEIIKEFLSASNNIVSA